MQAYLECLVFLLLLWGQILLSDQVHLWGQLVLTVQGYQVCLEVLQVHSPLWLQVILTVQGFLVLLSHLAVPSDQGFQVYLADHWDQRVPQDL